ncbi:RHS domain-containing protein [Gilliamella sp. WF3-4]|uniref:RHS domain-containing protein n=1 Tax=Gilliamella sp. WF3-4 TaxID=3120255 RepID=UPI0009BC917E|nr:RHS domain-containing protein [Gilliamella apicola]
MVRIDKRNSEDEETVYFHTDPNSAPEKLTDANSDIVWECSFQFLGSTFRQSSTTQ